jgi:aryl-alcohol dehydrogenase-like predicted oxidoreductase
MLYHKLGGTEIEISAVGFGAWAIGGWMWGGTDDEQATQAIHAALDQGINLIDTAPAYGFGRSEEIVGRAIAHCRDKVVLATKCGLIWDRQEGQFFFHADRYGAASGPAEKEIYRCLRPASIRAELEASLRRLGTGYIDLYQTHWQDPTTPIAQTMEVLVKLKEEGKIRAIGVSNASLDDLKAYGPIDADQERYSLLERAIQSGGSLDYCRRHQIGVLAYSPLDNGLLTGKIRPDREYGRGDLRKTNPRFQPAAVQKTNAMLESIRPVAERHGVSIAQAVIAWTISQPGITSALCGARNPQQAAENAAAAQVPLAPEEIHAIGEAVRA